MVLTLLSWKPSNQSWTVQTLFRIDAITSTAQMIWSKNSDTGATGLGVWLSYSSVDNKFGLSLYNGLGNRVSTVSANNTVQVGVWTLMTVVYDHTNSVVTVYRNGEVFVAPAACVGFSAVSTQNFCISRMGTSAIVQGIKGGVKSCQVFNRALTAAEVRSLFEKSGLKEIQETSGFGTPVSTASRGGITGSYLEQTRWQFGSTTPRYTIDTSTIQGEVVKTIKCATAGHLYKPTHSSFTPQQAAYGQWTIWINKAAASQTDFLFIADNNTLANSKYLLRLGATEYVQLVYNNSNMATTGVDAIVPSVWYRYRITRGFDNIFRCYVMPSGGSEALVLTTTANAAITSSAYSVLDLDASDQISIGSMNDTYNMTWKPFV